LALRQLLGEGAPLSASSLQRLKEKWEQEYEQWKSTAIEEKDWAYFWADGIYVKAGIGKEKTALLVVIGVQKDGSKRFLELEPSYRESKESWALVLRQMKSRGVKSARLSFHRFGSSSQFRPFMLLVVVATAFISRTSDT